jgi:hypothetical protein
MDGSFYSVPKLCSMRHAISPYDAAEEKIKEWMDYFRDQAKQLMEIGDLKIPEGPRHVQGEEVLDPGRDRRTIGVRREEREDLPLDPQKSEAIQGASDHPSRQREEALHGEVEGRVDEGSISFLL